MYKVGDIFYEDEKYSARAKFCNENGYTIKVIEPDENGRRFQICEPPEPTEEEILNELRARREVECFPIINRGQLWYYTLTPPQIEELDDWYEDWLDITKTKIVPEKPNWLK